MRTAEPAAVLFAAHAPELPAAVCRQAADWLVELQAGEACSAQTRARWRAWRAADPMHEQAWQRIESCLQGLAALPPRASAQTLAGLPAPGRRRAMKALALLASAGGGALLAAQAPAGRRLRADYRTGTAERLALRLDDGTRATLNAASALDILYTDTHRRLRLIEGEVFLESAPDPLAGPARAARPLEVLTGQGLVRAVGTRFSVAQLQDGTQASVYDGMVEVQPMAAAGSMLRLHAGQQAYFDAAGVRAARPAAQQAPGWLQGMLVADDMRLDEFLRALSAYRPGLLTWSDGVAGLRISGTYPLDDTDAVLRAVQALLPVQAHTYVRYWTRVEPRSA